MTSWDVHAFRSGAAYFWQPRKGEMAEAKPAAAQPSARPNTSRGEINAGSRGGRTRNALLPRALRRFEQEILRGARELENVCLRYEEARSTGRADRGAPDSHRARRSTPRALRKQSRRSAGKGAWNDPRRGGLSMLERSCDDRSRHVPRVRSWGCGQGPRALTPRAGTRAPSRHLRRQRRAEHQ